MFTPENFYCVIRENFVVPNNRVMIKPSFNGAKDIIHFESFFVRDEHFEQDFFRPISKKTRTGLCLMYDQEPLTSSAANIYRQIRCDSTDETLHDTIHGMTVGQLAATWLRTTKIPIWCTSEYQSPLLEDLQENFFVKCHYWYHAFIARDWFRHWSYNKHLECRNKSDSDKRFILYARATDGTRQYRQNLLDHLRAFRRHILHDWDQQLAVDPSLSAVIDVGDANRSAIHLVAETLFDHQSSYLTEKVFKPMVMSQPFLLWAPAGCLSYIKKYGFKTFDHVWSEGYDDETDAGKRMQMLIAIVQDLCGRSQQEFQSIYDQCLPVIEHNRRWFFSQEFQDLCWQELTVNFQSAVREADSLEQMNPGGQLVHVCANNPHLLKVPFWTVALKQYLVNQETDQQRQILARYPVLADL